MNKFKITICPGHTTKRVGAVANGKIEHNEVVIITEYLYDYLYDYDFIKVYKFTGTLPQKVSYINSINSDIAIDIHLNAVVNRTVTGTETLHSGFNNSILLAENVQNELVACLKLKDRGIKKGYFHGDKNKPMLYFLRKTKCPSIIPEPLFISNKNDLYSLNHRMIAEAIGLGILSYFNKWVSYGNN